VSAGGNLLLDIGPAADGTIPVIMQQRLMEIGNWLKTNGEAIYGTRLFIRTKKDQAINPDTNKNLFFTQKDKVLYVICTDWPVGNILLKGVNPTGKVNVSLLGTVRRISVKSSGRDLTILDPVLTPDDYQPAYVFRITGLLK
jgi:alpha-L-fucosidase